MEAQAKNCQNCKKDFTIEPADFDFYKKIDVPPPTFCPECRLQRRYSWRNERTFWKGACSHCKKSLISGYPPDAGFTIFCHDCWVSDTWDPMSYGQEYDFTKPFFEQWAELAKKAPRMNLYQLNCINSPYLNIAVDSKDSYLSFSVTKCEEAFYSKNVDRSKHIFDCLNTMDSERCHATISGAQNYEVIYSVAVRNCLKSAFLFDCVNCSNCFMSANLRNKEYVFYNKQLSKEQYDLEMSKLEIGSHAQLLKLRKDFLSLYTNAVHKYANILKSVDSTGDNLANDKNTRRSFDVYDSENISYSYRSYGLKDCMDTNNTISSELVYEYTSGGRNARNLKFSIASFGSEQSCTYTGWCGSSVNLFGCFGLRNKQYCILNKQYTKEQYESLVPRIIAHMNEMPYQGKNGRVYRYGDFFPCELSPFPYNGSTALEHFPMDKSAILAQGYNYRESEIKNPEITKLPGALPDDIAMVDDDILLETIGCEHAGECIHQCTLAFKVVPSELQWYRSMNISLPRACPNCRHYERLYFKNPWKLWPRECMCESVKHASHKAGPCHSQFETAYAPERKERVYCENCYQAEIS